jgi:hypothetical protein
VGEELKRRMCMTRWGKSTEYLIGMGRPYDTMIDQTNFRDFEYAKDDLLKDRTLFLSYIALAGLFEF